MENGMLSILNIANGSVRHPKSGVYSAKPSTSAICFLMHPEPFMTAAIPTQKPPRMNNNPLPWPLQQTGSTQTPPPCSRCEPLQASPSSPCCCNVTKHTDHPHLFPLFPTRNQQHKAYTHGSPRPATQPSKHTSPRALIDNNPHPSLPKLPAVHVFFLVKSSCYQP